MRSLCTKQGTNPYIYKSPQSTFMLPTFISESLQWIEGCQTSLSAKDFLWICYQNSLFSWSLKNILLSLSIDVVAGKFLRVRKIFFRISPNLPEKCLGHFLCEYFLMKTVFGITSKKGSCNSPHVGRHFFKIKSDYVEHHFCHLFREFAQIFRDFDRIFTKSKLLGMRLHPPFPPPTPLSLSFIRRPWKFLYSCEAVQYWTTDYTEHSRIKTKRCNWPEYRVDLFHLKQLCSKRIHCYSAMFEKMCNTAITKKYSKQA